MQQQGAAPLGDATQRHSRTDLAVILAHGGEKPHYHRTGDNDALRHVHPAQGGGQLADGRGRERIRTGDNAGQHHPHADRNQRQQVEKHALTCPGHDEDIHGQQAKIQRGQPQTHPDLAREEKQQQTQRGGRSLGRRAYMEEQQQVCQQQQIQLGAGIHTERHATIPAFSKCFFIMRWPNSPPSTAQTKIAAIAATKLPLLMGANSVSM